MWELLTHGAAFLGGVVAAYLYPRLLTWVGSWVKRTPPTPPTL